MDNTAYYDPPVSDAQPRQALFEGQLLVSSPRQSYAGIYQVLREVD